MKKSLVLVADGSEEIELVAVVDILRRGGVEVCVAGIEQELNVMSRKVRLMADTTLAQLVNPMDYDVLVLPGGMAGALAFCVNDQVQSLIKKFYHDPNKYLALICAAPLALKAAKIGLEATITSHPSVKKDLVELYKYSEKRVVVDHKIITSRGPGTAIEFGLEILKILCGVETFLKVKNPLVLWEE